jgi:hypothetical protein
MGFLGQLSNFHLFKDLLLWCVCVCVYEMRGDSKIRLVKNIFFSLLILLASSLIYDNIIFCCTKTPHISIKTDIIKCQVTTIGAHLFQVYKLQQ